MKKEVEIGFHEGKSPNLVEGEKFFDTSFDHDNDNTIFGKNKKWNEDEIEKFKKSMGMKKMKKLNGQEFFQMN